MRFLQHLQIVSWWIFSLTVLAQVPLETPLNDPNPPVEHEIKLSGTFGELRGNHFHGGLDIKSKNGSWGDPIFAIEQGYISRVSISAGGFGNALYITHPSGITSVYAHLQSFTPEIEAYVLAQQYAKKTFEINLDFTPDQFMVNKGELIGKMGSTGYSFGPHLHMEIRNAKTDKTINPLRYSFLVPDLTPPIIKSVSIYSLDHTLFNYASSTIATEGLTDSDTLEADAWRIGLGLETYDPHNGGHNKNGIYSAKIWVDEKPIYAFVFDSIGWQEMNFFSAHIDYAAKETSDRKVHKCYRLPTNHLSIYNSDYSDGVIPIFRNRIQHIKAEVADFAGNKAATSFFLRQSDTVSVPDYPLYQYHVKPGKAQKVSRNNIQLLFGADALYEDLYLDFHSSEDSLSKGYSAIYQVHDKPIPLKNAINLMIKPRLVPDTLRSKLIIASQIKAGKIRYHDSTWEGDWLSADIAQLGNFQVIADTSAPTIAVLQNKITSNGRTLVFKIEDDQSGAAGDLTYQATLDDTWVLAKYDLKSNRLTCELDQAFLKKGLHHFKLLVTDAVNNSAEYDYRFSTK